MTVFVDDPDFTLHVGDALDVLAGLPDESVHCVVTSPPYWGLRDYGTGSWDGGDPECDHRSPTMREGRNEDRAKLHGSDATNQAQLLLAHRSACGKCGAVKVDHQLGLEPTPDEYVANMVGVFREVRRVLRRDGTCWCNLGDAYVSGQGGRQSAGGELPSTSRFGRPDPKPRPDLPNPPAGWAERAVTRRTYPGRETGLKPKDLYGMPWRVAFALQADGWYLRSDIIWSKPNPMPESVTDRPTKAHEYLFLLSRSPRYFYDADAIREPAEWARWGDQTNGKHEGSGSAAGWIGSKTKNELTGDRRKVGFNGRCDASVADGSAPTGRNKRSVWEIATQPYPDAHFATFPQALVEPCILAGTSERGCCPECGAPWERETEKHFHSEPTYKQTTEDPLLAGRNRNVTRMGDGVTVETTGWRPTCDHGHAPIPATVLDPFMGSGTTALVARRLGRKSIGIELNEEYAALAAERLQQLSLLADA